MTPKAKATTQSPKAPPKRRATPKAKTATDAAAAAAAAAKTAAAAATAAAASANKAAAAAVAAATAADNAAAALTLARSAAGVAPAAEARPSSPGDDPLVAFCCPLPAFFEYLATSRRRSIPPMRPPRPLYMVTSAWSGCKCRDCSSPACSCPCRADVELGLSAIARGGPEAVVLLVECGQCACVKKKPRNAGGGGGGSGNDAAAPGQQFRRLACRPTQGGCGFRVSVRAAAAPGSKGRGLFAREAIPAGAFVLEYAGEALSSEAAAAQLRAYDEARRRWRRRAEEGEQDDAGEEEPGGASGHALLKIVVHGRMTPIGAVAAGPYRLCASIDATRRGNAARFVNHSCDPNLGAVLVRNRRSSDVNDAASHAAVPFRVALFSRRAVAVGQELTMSYGDGGGGGGGGGASRCECGAAACDGWLPSGGAAF